jgi:predicted RNA-binding protein YlxR (DUF448 family)
MCVGCRERAPASELLRVVAVAGDAETVSVVPDPTRRRPGRGASLHADPACLALAERRRAFGRALRVTGVVDTGPLAEFVETVALGLTADEAPVASSGQQGRTTDMSTR